MLKFALGAFLVFLLMPFSQSFAQDYDNTTTLSVSLTSEIPYVYRDSDGYTVVVGTVKNENTQTSVTHVMIQVNFFDDLDPTPLEVVQGRTILEVIPPNGESPFSIKSQTPDSEITEASISILGFDSSSSKQNALTVYSSEVLLDDRLSFKGVLQNGGAPSSNTNVYLTLYDGFEPPRILEVITLELGDVESGGEVSFNVNRAIDARAIGFLLFAESDVFSSNFVDVEIPEPQALTKLVSISSVTVNDSQGDRLSEIPVGSIVDIESKIWIQFAADQTTNETPYTYYVQIKESATGKIEYLGKDDGRFIGAGPQLPTIDWMPKNSGLYFLETFVWDRNNIPIAERGPFVIINVQ